MAHESCYGHNAQKEAPWIRFIWAAIFIGINVAIFAVTVIQIYRSRGLLRSYSTHKVKVTTRGLNCVIALLCITLAVIDLDTWIFSECPPSSNWIYIVYTLIKVITETALCISAVALGYNLFRSYYRIANGGSNTGNHNRTNSDSHIRLPQSMTIGWPLIGAFWVLCAVVCVFVAYWPLHFVQAIVLYVDVRQILASLTMFYFSFCIYLLKRQGKIKFTSNTMLKRLYYGLILLGVLCFCAGITLTTSTIHKWSTWNLQNVTYYGLITYNGIQYFLVLVFLGISWGCYWLLLLALIRQVYTKTNQHALQMSQRAINSTATQSVDMYAVSS